MLQSNPDSDPFVNQLLMSEGKPRKAVNKVETVFMSASSGGNKKNPPPTTFREIVPLYEEEDVKSVYSERSSLTHAQKLLESYPPLEPSVREARRELYHHERYPYKTIEEVEAEKQQKILTNNLGLEQLVNYVKFSKEFMELKRTAIVPGYCSNLNHGGFHGEVAIDLTKDVEYKPKNPGYCFGSTWDWAQGGLDVPPLSAPGGDLDNIYVIKFSFTALISSCPCAVGVLLGEVKKDGFHPMDKRTFYSDTGYRQIHNITASGSWDGCTFHCIIPPFQKTYKEKDFYRSSTHLNNPYGQEYPFLTSDETKIKHRCEPMGKNGINGFVVPLYHPVLDWCFNESNLPESELPKKSQDHSDDVNKHFWVTKKVMDLAVACLKEKAELYIPVTNMTQVALKFVPLTSGPFSSDQILRETCEREYTLDVEWQKSIDSALTTKDAEKKQKRKDLKDKYGIYFEVECFTMFRKYAIDALEVAGGEDDTFSQ
jgi:hypothetical protein